MLNEAYTVLFKNIHKFLFSEPEFLVASNRVNTHKLAGHIYKVVIFLKRESAQHGVKTGKLFLKNFLQDVSSKFRRKVIWLFLFLFPSVFQWYGCTKQKFTNSKTVHTTHTKFLPPI